MDIKVTQLPEIDVDMVGPVEIAGIPDHFTLDIGQLPKIQLGIDPVEIKPLSIAVELKQIPSIRAHLPADFSVGLSILGMELLCLRLCGEAQIITEPYRQNPCERCGDTRVVEVSPTSPPPPLRRPA